MNNKNSQTRHKYIFVIGGVMSGVGKGIATSSIGTLLSSKGFSVNLIKVDPYLNVDAGTMNPTEHGEVFVLDSGLETDQDMGNYERFLGRDLTADDYITSGMVYKYVIEKERALGYGGKCVEAIPHLRDEIVRRFEHSAKVNKSDISIIEIGGTVGDYQNTMFIEAARFLKMRHPTDVIFIMVSYLPIPSKLGEMKTRPTQHAVQQLASYGVNTDIVIARADHPLDERRKDKIAAACNIPIRNVISAPDIESIYDVPINFKQGKIDEIVLEALHIDMKEMNGRLKKENKKLVGGGLNIDFNEWSKMARGIKNHGNKVVNIAIVGKYFATGDFTLKDSYLSVLEAVKFSAYKVGVKVVIHAVNAQDFEEGKLAERKGLSILDQYDGIIVPGGFGSTGIEGKLNVIRYARENKIPYFGLCYGMQLLVIEYARNVLGLSGAHTAEINPRSPHPVIDVMPDQKKKIAAGNYGGSMRLGLYPAKLMKDTIAYGAYNDAIRLSNEKSKKDLMRDATLHISVIKERHRHRYEVNPKYVKQLEKAGLIFSGKSPDGTLMEIAELPRGNGASDSIEGSDVGRMNTHPFFLGTQFHPELLARPLRPHPLFTAFIGAAKRRSKEREVKTKKQSVMAPDREAGK
jgi:CTP synthase